jgi:flagellar motor switch protein FliM
VTADNSTKLTARARRRGVVVGYDFSAPARLSREHSRLLEIAFETFARQWTTQLGSRLRCHTQVSLTSVTEETYDAYVAALPGPSALVPFSQEGYGIGVLQLSTRSALAHLDHALGGPGGEQPHRQLTDIEVSVTLGMCERALGTLGYAFAAVAPLQPRVDGLQQDPQLVQAARATDMVVVATFNVELGRHVEQATLMLPLAPLMARLSSAAPEDVRSVEEIQRAFEAARTLSAAMTDVPVDVAVRMSPVPVPPERVLRLAVGDLLPLSHPSSRPLEVAVADTVVGSAVPTTRGNRRACLIVRHEEDPR